MFYFNLYLSQIRSFSPNSCPDHSSILTALTYRNRFIAVKFTTNHSKIKFSIKISRRCDGYDRSTANDQGTYQNNRFIVFWYNMCVCVWTGWNRRTKCFYFGYSSVRSDPVAVCVCQLWRRLRRRRRPWL